MSETQETTGLGFSELEYPRYRTNLGVLEGEVEHALFCPLNDQGPSVQPEDPHDLLDDAYSELGFLLGDPRKRRGKKNVLTSHVGLPGLFPRHYSRFEDHDIQLANIMCENLPALVSPIPEDETGFVSDYADYAILAHIVTTQHRHPGDNFPAYDQAIELLRNKAIISRIGYDIDSGNFWRQSNTAVNTRNKEYSSMFVRPSFRGLSILEGLLEIDHPDPSDQERLHDKIRLEAQGNPSAIASLIHSRSEELYGIGVTALASIIERLGFSLEEAQQLSEVWRHTGSLQPTASDHTILTAAKHILRLDYTDKSMNRGDALELFRRFNIHCFDRYSPIVLNRMLARKPDSPAFAYIFSLRDPNGAFAMDSEYLSSFLIAIERQLGLSPLCIEARRESDIARTVISNTTEGSIKEVCIAAHGSKESLVLGATLVNDDIRFHSTQTRHLRGLSRLSPLGNRLARHAPITVNACSAGIEGGYAQALSAALETTSKGPSNPVSVDWPDPPTLKDSDIPDPSYRIHEGCRHRPYRYAHVPSNTFENGALAQR